MRHLLTRAQVAFLHDLLMAGLSFILALYLRVGHELWPYLDKFLWPAFLTFLAVSAAVFTTRTL